MNDNDVRSILINPYYAITISPDLYGKHDPLVPKDHWIKANARLIAEIGAEAWLANLLTALEGNVPRAKD